MPVAKSWWPSCPGPSPPVSSEAPRVRLPFLIPRTMDRRSSWSCCSSSSPVWSVTPHLSLFSPSPPSQTTRRSHSSTYAPRDDTRDPQGHGVPGRSRCPIRVRPDGRPRGDRWEAVWSAPEPDRATERRASHPYSARSVGRTPPSRRRPRRTPAGAPVDLARGARRRTGPPTHDR